MVKIKTASEIKNDLINFHSKIQDKLTDFGPLSVVGGLFYSFATVGEMLYTKMDEVAKQSFIATAEGNYLDRHIEGTFGLGRNQRSRASGYVIVYSNAPIQNPGNVKLKCAYFNSEGELVDSDVADKFVTSGNDSYAGRVFTLIAPSNNAAVSKFTDTSGRVVNTVNLNNAHPRFLILPVVSLLEGADNNVPEGAINQFPTKPAGIDGVLNSYSPQDVFFSTPESYDVPFSIRFTDSQDIRNSEEGETIFDVSTAFYFSEKGGLLGLEDRKGNKLRGKYYRRISTAPYFDFTNNPIEKDLTLDYNEAQSGTISLVKPIGVATDFTASMEELPILKVKNNLGNYEDWSLLSIVYNDNEYNLAQATGVYPGVALFNFLKDRINNDSKLGLVVRQVKAPIDSEFVFDPDGVLGVDGLIIESARIGGAAEAEGDDAYRLKLKKYLSSLSKATDAAIEGGALQVKGVSYAKVIRNEYTPRGSTILLISSTSGIVDKGTFFATKRLLEREYKASGINLILKTPQQVDITVLISVTLMTNFENSKDAVNEDIVNSIYKYFLNKVPGDTLSYSQLITSLSNIKGIRNVWNMFFGRRLTTHFYKINKISAVWDSMVTDATGSQTVNVIKYGGYDYELLMNALKNPTYKDRTVNLAPNQAEGVYLYCADDTSTSYVRNGTSYNPTAEDNYKRTVITTNGVSRVVEIFEDATWGQLSGALKRINTAGDFVDFVVSRRFELFLELADNRHALNYQVTRFCSEATLLDYSQEQSIDVPIKVENIELKLLKEINMGTFEVPKLSNVVHEGDVIDFLGVDYTSE